MRTLRTIALTIGLAGCATTAQAQQAAAIVNGAEIVRAHLDAQIEALAGSGQFDADPVAGRLRTDVLEQLITQELLWQAATARGYTIEEAEVDARLEAEKRAHESEAAFLAHIRSSGFSESTYRDDLRRRLAVERLIAREIVPLGGVRREEIDAFYAANLEAMELPEEIHLRHILIEVDERDAAGEAVAHATIERMLAEARAGADFATLARAHSDAPTAAQGGDLGFVGRGQLVAPLERAAFALAPGQISDIVRTESGYHLVKAEARRGGLLEREDAADLIGHYLMQQRIQQGLAAFVRTLRAQAAVEMLE